MKKITYLLILLGFVITSCDKDDDGPTKNSHRLKQVIYGDEEYGNKYVYFYENEKVTEILSYDKNQSGDWEDEGKTTCEYSDNLITSITSEYVLGILEPYYKEEIILENNKWKERIVYYYEGGSWEKSWGVKFTYEGNLLVLVEETDYDGSETYQYKGEFSYIDNKVSEYLGYEYYGDKWQIDDKETVSYEDGKISIWMDYDLDENDQWEESSKDKYYYIGDNCSKIEWYYYDNYEDLGWELEGFETFLYNENNYIIKSVDGDWETVYEYEEGNGNISSFLSPWESLNSYPSPKSATGNKDKANPLKINMKKFL